MTTTAATATGGRGCGVCGRPVPARPRGRPAVYCSRACQAKAYRARRADRVAAGPGPAAGPVSAPPAEPQMPGAPGAPGALPPVPPPVPPRVPQPAAVTEARVLAQLRAQPGGRVAAGSFAVRHHARDAAALLAEAAAQLAAAIEQGGSGDPPAADAAALLGFAQRQLYVLGVLAHQAPATDPPEAPAAPPARAESRDETPTPASTPAAAAPAAPPGRDENQTRDETTGRAADRNAAEDRAEPARQDGQDGQDDGQDGREEGPGRLRTVGRLGADWALDDDEVLWWRRETRVGSVAKAWPGSGWQARRRGGLPVTTGADVAGGRYRSRIKALTALAADFDHRRRAATPHTDLPAEGLPGWRLTQTLADRDADRWILHTPDGVIAGHLTREAYGKQRAEWRATAGDRDSRHYQPINVPPLSGDPDGGVHDDLWRTRTAAAHALATWHDPDLDPTVTTRDDAEPAAVDVPAAGAGAGDHGGVPVDEPADLADNRDAAFEAADDLLMALDGERDDELPAELAAAIGPAADRLRAVWAELDGAAELAELAAAAAAAIEAAEPYRTHWPLPLAAAAAAVTAHLTPFGRAGRSPADR